MITEQDLQEAIAECKGQRNPDARTCIKLAAYYTLQDHLFPAAENPPESLEKSFGDNLRGYSYAPAPGIDYDGKSEFAQAIQGRDPAQVWPLVEKLVETVRVLNSRLYAGFIGEILNL